MTHFLGKVPAVFKTKELSNVLEKQLKNLMTHFINKLYRQSLLQIQVHLMLRDKLMTHFINKLYRQSLLQIQVHLMLRDKLMTHFLGKVPAVFKTIELPLKWLKYISFIIGKIMKLM